MRVASADAVIYQFQEILLVHWDDPEGWNGEGGGRRVQDGDPKCCLRLRKIKSFLNKGAFSTHYAECAPWRKLPQGCF